MPFDACGDCGEQFVWDSEASSGVCPQCGTLQDPSQNVLAAHLDSCADENQIRYEHAAPSSSSVSRPITLKSIRNSDRGWDLPGQGRLAYTERAKYAMHKYTAALASRLGYPGLTARAQFVFDQAMEKGRFRWGRRARLVSGAAMLIILREAQKGETVNDISYLVNESPVQLARTLTVVLGLVQIKLATIDPSWHFPSLQKHLVDVIAKDPCVLPAILVRALKTIHLPCARKTATSLSDLVSRACILANASSPSTACAIYILALEGEALSPLPNCTELAKELGKRFGVSGDLVMKRYKVIYEQIEAWSKSVPWLVESVGEEAEKRRRGTRSVKISKRTGMARVLKDVVEHQEGAWQGRLRSQGMIELRREDTVEEEADVSSFKPGSSERVDVQGMDRGDVVASKTHACAGHDAIRPKRRVKRAAVDVASQFLLSPSDTRENDASKRARTNGTTITKVNMETLAHVLTNESATLALNRPATRLQLLLGQKRESDIGDEELFGEGELENMMRKREEVDILAKTFDWAQEGDDGGDRERDDDRDDGYTEHAQRRDRTRGGTRRVNMDALKRLLAESEQERIPEEGVYDEEDSDTYALVFDDIDDNDDDI